MADTTFGERFGFSLLRWRTRTGAAQESELAGALGVVKSQITTYKAQEGAPPPARTLEIARLADVDPGWLAFGSDSAAPAPEGFPRWLEGHRRKAKPQVVTGSAGAQSGRTVGQRLRDLTGLVESGRTLSEDTAARAAKKTAARRRSGKGSGGGG